MTLPDSKWKFNTEKGITLLEILAVLVIIALVFIALSRNFGFGTDKAKQTDVQQAFKPYQIGMEGMLNEYSGVPTSGSQNVDYVVLNRYLGKEYQIATPTNGTGTTRPTSNPIQTTSLNDPWNVPYRLQAKYMSPSEWVVVVRSFGKDKALTNTNDLFTETNDTTDKDDFYLVTHYKNGRAKTCSKGFERNVGKVDITYGTGLSYTIDYDLSLATRSARQSTYTHEYAVDVRFRSGGPIFRNYFYSNSPMTVTHDTGSFPHTITSANGFIGFKWWSINQWKAYEEDKIINILLSFKTHPSIILSVLL